MSAVHPLRFSPPLLLTLAVAACARPPRTAELPRAGVQLQRVAELPGAPSVQQPCAMRLRDPATRREYLILESRTRVATSATDTSTATSLVGAVGEYAAVPAGDSGGPPAAALRVDCVTSRVVAVLAPAPAR